MSKSKPTPAQAKEFAAILRTFRDTMAERSPELKEAIERDRARRAAKGVQHG